MLQWDIEAQSQGYERPMTEKQNKELYEKDTISMERALGSVIDHLTKFGQTMPVEKNGGENESMTMLEVRHNIHMVHWSAIEWN